MKTSKDTRVRGAVETMDPALPDDGVCRTVTALAAIGVRVRRARRMPSLARAEEGCAAANTRTRYHSYAARKDVVHP